MAHATKIPVPEKVVVSDEEYYCRMLNATARLHDVLQRLGRGRRIIFDRQPDGQMRSADYDVQSALREIDTVVPVADEELAS